MKLRVIEPTQGDFIIIDETKVPPKAVGREQDLRAVIVNIGKLVGVDIEIERYSGDYLYKILSKQEK
jgi:hypothetical protein